MKVIINCFFMSSLVLLNPICALAGGEGALKGRNDSSPIEPRYEYIRTDLKLMDLRTADRKYFRAKNNPRVADLQRAGTYRLDELSFGDVFESQGIDAVDTGILDLDAIKKEASIRYVGPIEKRPANDNVYLFSIGGDTYRLIFVESVEDIKYGLTHVSAIVEGEPGSYVKFTFDPETNNLVGTASVSKGIFRITSTPGYSGQHVIYKLNENSGLDRRSGRSLVNGEFSFNLWNVEKRHLAVDMLSEIQPFIYKENVSPSVAQVNIVGGNLGGIKLDDVERDSELIVKKVLNQFELVIGSSGMEEYKVDYVSGSSTSEYFIRYHQVIEGVPVDKSGYVRLDGASGNLIGFYSVIIFDSNSGVEKIETISRGEAITYAIEKIEAEEGGALANKELKEKDAILSYRILDGKKVLVWKIKLRGFVGGRYVSYLAYVNSSTGDVELSTAIRRAKQNTDFQTDVCKVFSGQPTTCPFFEITPPTQGVSGPILTETESNGEANYSCTGTETECSVGGRYHSPWLFLNQAEHDWSTASGSACCTKIGDLGGTEKLNVMVDSVVGNGYGPSYEKYDSIIHLPVSGQAQTIPGSESSLSADPIVHEAGHAYQYEYNTTIEQMSDAFANAFKEGMSDVLAALFTKMNPSMVASSGNPWNIMEDIEYSSVQRDLAATGGDLKYPENYDASKTGGHQNGKIVGHLFFHLSQDGVSDQKLLGLALKVQKIIYADGSSLEPSDLRRALDSAASGDTTLTGQIDIAWPKVFTVPAPPNPPSCTIPSPPANIDGIPTTSCSSGASWYTNFWDSSSGADYYNVWYSLDGLNWIYSFSTTGTIVPTYNTVDVFVTVQSVNSCGLSALALDWFFQAYLCNF